MRRHQRIVGVEHRGAVGRQRLHELALARLDGLEGAGPRQVDRAHGRDDPDGRPRDGAQLARCRPVT